MDRMVSASDQTRATFTEEDWDLRVRVTPPIRKAVVPRSVSRLSLRKYKMTSKLLADRCRIEPYPIFLFKIN